MYNFALAAFRNGARAFKMTADLHCKSWLKTRTDTLKEIPSLMAEYLLTQISRQEKNDFLL